MARFYYLEGKDEGFTFTWTINEKGEIELLNE